MNRARRLGNFPMMCCGAALLLGANPSLAGKPAPQAEAAPKADKSRADGGASKAEAGPADKAAADKAAVSEGDKAAVSEGDKAAASEGDKAEADQATVKQAERKGLWGQADDAARKRGLRRAAITLGVLGAAGLLTGGILHVMDGRVSAGTCQYLGQGYDPCVYQIDQAAYLSGYGVGGGLILTSIVMGFISTF